MHVVWLLVDGACVPMFARSVSSLKVAFFDRALHGGCHSARDDETIRDRKNEFFRHEGMATVATVSVLAR